jgi:hypothetical protein
MSEIGLGKLTSRLGKVQCEAENTRPLVGRVGFEAAIEVGWAENGAVGGMMTGLAKAASADDCREN